MRTAPFVATVGVVFGLNLAGPGLVIWLEWSRLGHRPPWALIIAAAAWQAVAAAFTGWSAVLLWWDTAAGRRRIADRQGRPDFD